MLSYFIRRTRRPHVAYKINLSLSKSKQLKLNWRKGWLPVWVETLEKAQAMPGAFARTWEAPKKLLAYPSHRVGRVRQISVCLGSWLSLRSLTIVDCQSQIPHIKPPCFQVCRQIWHFVVNLSVWIVHFQVIWGPGKMRLKLMNWGRPPRTDIVHFFYRFSYMMASLTPIMSNLPQTSIFQLCVLCQRL